MLLRSLELLSGPYMEAAVTVSEPAGKVVSLYSNMGHGPFRAVEEKNQFHENILSVRQVEVEVKVGG